MSNGIVRPLVLLPSMYFCRRFRWGVGMHVGSLGRRFRDLRPLGEPICRRLVGALFVLGAAFLPGAAAHAQGVPFLDEVKLGVLAHSVGGYEGGVDLNADFLFVSPVTEAMLSGLALPQPLQWFAMGLLRPRPDIGFEANTAGDTSTFYFGGTWTWYFVRNLFQAGDGVNGSVIFGPSFNNGDIAPHGLTRNGLGSNVLFHIGGELGYRITPRYEVSLFFDHESNAGLARFNEGNNDAGVRFGVSF